MTLKEAQEFYLATVENEKRLHDASVLDIPEMICGVLVKPLTPRMFALLKLKHSPLIDGGELSSNDFLLFMAIVSDTILEPEKRKEIVEQTLQVEPQELLEGITKY